MQQDNQAIDDDNLMDMKQVAEYLGIQYPTFTAYVYRGYAPECDVRLRNVRLWSKETIDNWNESRSRK